MPDFNKLSKPGLIPVKVENQGSLITTQVNKINFTGSGVTASVGQFNDLTILITGGGGSGVSSSYALSASYAQTASYFSGSISNAISASYASSSTSASYALSASYAETSSLALTAQNILVYCKNQTGFNITKGMVVRITGSNNSSDIPRITTASYENDDNSANTLGIANEAISNGSEGYVMTEGILKGIDTTNYTSGQLLYLGATGSITGSAPVAPLHAVRLGEVIRHQSNNGSIYVRVDNGYELGELHNVIDNTTTSSYGDLLIKSGSQWINSKSLTGSYSITGSLVVTSFTGSLSGSLIGTASWANSASQALTASFALNAFPYTGSARITGSLGLTGSLTVSGSASTNSAALLLYKSGSTVLDIQGSQGQLFSVVDTLTGSLMSVNDVSGLPILEVFSDDKVVLGTYGAPGLTVTGSQFFGTGSITGSLTGSLLGTGSWAVSASQAITASYVLNAISASYALSSSFATTASYAYSASYEIIKEVSSSYADTASYLTPLSQSVLITGSLGLTGSLSVYKSGSTVVDIQGSSGQLFSITDSLTGSLFSVNTVAGLPVIEAFSDNTVNIGKFGVYPIKVAATGTLAQITGSLTGSLTGSVLGTASFATTASWALNARLLNGTSSFGFATTSSNTFSGSQTITGSTNISGAFNLVGDINASSNTVVINSPSIALPGLAFPYTPSPTVNTVMFDTSNNVLFVTSSLPGGGGSGLADRIQTGSITASVAVGSNPLYPYFFLLQSGSRELLKFNTEGVMQLEAYYTTPTPITGAIYYSASGEFFFGL